VWAVITVYGFKITPSTKLHVQQLTGQHEEWVRQQKRYMLIHKGQESLRDWGDRKLAERLTGMLSGTRTTADALASHTANATRLGHMSSAIEAVRNPVIAGGYADVAVAVLSQQESSVQ
jgi:hypothetical protein